MELPKYVMRKNRNISTRKYIYPPIQKKSSTLLHKIPSSKHCPEVNEYGLYTQTL